MSLCTTGTRPFILVKNLNYQVTCASSDHSHAYILKLICLMNEALLLQIMTTT